MTEVALSRHFAKVRPMKNLSIQSRLVLLVGSLLILLVAAAGFTVMRMTASNELLGSLYNDRVVAPEQLKRVADAYNEVVDSAHKVGSGAIAPAVGATQVKAALAKADKRWKEYAASIWTTRSCRSSSRRSR